MKPTVICLTPVWNEAWILDRFLRAASVWADHIVVADQNSDDGSREIIRRYPKALLVENESPTYDEGARQRLLIDAARRFPGTLVLIAIDADEMLTAGASTTPAWRDALAAPPGTALLVRLINLLPGCKEAWIPKEPMVVGLVDDGRKHGGSAIHSRRVPVAPEAPAFVMEGIGLLHLQYLDERRMRAKQRWYQCWERVERPQKRPAEIYRQYHYMDAWPESEVHPVPARWLDGLELQGLEKGTGGEDVWHRRILDLMRTHGPRRFSRVDIWDVDWPSEARRLSVDLQAPPTTNALNRLVLRYLRFAQSRRRFAPVRAISRSLWMLGW